MIKFGAGVAEDLKKIEEYVRNGFDRSTTISYSRDFPLGERRKDIGLPTS